MNILFVNCCMRRESRTERLARVFLKAYCQSHPQDTVEELDLKVEQITSLTEVRILRREQAVENGELQNPLLSYARQFQQADKILIAAPYWDLSFPSLLKVYFEQIFVVGITFGCTADGLKGRCNAQKCLYLTTAGGEIGKYDLGSQYVSGLCETMLSIPEFQVLKVENLDIQGADVESLMRAGEQQAEEYAQTW